jgi:raffinose/stachyose/melibiose transport system substrate-binding protein
MKKLFLIAVPVFMLVSLLTGCSGKGASPAAVVKLEYYNQKPEATQIFEDIIQEFHKANPGIQIEQTAPPDPETVLFARVASGEMPDILFLWPAEYFYQQLMKEALLLDITDQPFMSRANQDYVEMGNYGGRSYAVPMSVSAYGLYYNKDIFEKYSLKPPATWDEFIAVCKTLKQNGVQPIVFRDRDQGQEFERLIGILNPDVSLTFERIAGGETSFTREPELRRLAESMLEIREYGQQDTLGTDTGQARTDFFNQRAAMFINGSWMLADLRTYETTLRTEMVPFPNAMGGPNLIPINIDTAFSAGSHLSDAETGGALKFMDFLTTPEIAQIYADREGSPNVILSTRQNIAELPVVLDKIQKGEVFLSLINFWPAGLRNAWIPSIQELIQTKNVDRFLSTSDTLMKEFYTQEFFESR